MCHADYRSAKAVLNSKLEERLQQPEGVGQGWWSRLSSQLGLRLGCWLVDIGEELEQRAALPAASDARRPRGLEQGGRGALLL
jgi:hypothetical protein